MGRKPSKYLWTAERDALLVARYDGKIKHRAAELAAQLGWPTWVIKKRASVLGLSYPLDRRDWTNAEVKFLTTWVGYRHVVWMARRLKRSLSSVVLKLKRMKLARRVRFNGYRMRDLERCFGCDHCVIERWIREGKLHASRRNPEGPRGGAWQIPKAEVLRFIRTHPMAFRLDKVDQAWFMDLVIGGGLLQIERDDEAA